MFSDIPHAAIVTDLQRTGSVDVTIENILRDGGLPMVCLICGFEHMRTASTLQLDLSHFRIPIAPSSSCASSRDDVFVTVVIVVRRIIHTITCPTVSPPREGHTRCASGGTTQSVGD